ncbi:MAG TPA: GTPase, partial [Candidatus Limnocylindrales bacterium]|nr:GTPase [Candidatus Limnocylindrales bacterium]
PGDAYVLALVGGTGVGKSTLLNALAGEQVSAASARRPTTSEPVAWIPAGKARELTELISWLGITRVKEHAAGQLGDVAILDLPDVDSIAPQHRAKVDELLPRVDAVAWVVDPQKYNDDVAHRAYLREWGPRIARQIVVLNRADLLSGDDASRVRDDLRARLHADGLEDTTVALTRARDGEPGIRELRTWIASGVDAKRIVAATLGAGARDATREMARRAGVEDGNAAPLVDPERRERAMKDVARGALAVIDIRGLERQAVAATRLAARPRGAGPLGLLTSAIYRLSGRARVAADPAGYLRRWQSRGSLAPALEPLRGLLQAALPGVPVALRGRIAELSTPDVVERRLSDAVDRTLQDAAADFRAPSSFVWAVIGFGQDLVMGLLIFAALWFASLFVLDQPATGSVIVPVLGPIPAPVALLAGVLLAGFRLAQLLRMHAGGLGRRWARRIATLITRDVNVRASETILLPLEQLDRSREQLARAVASVGRDCA